MTGITTVLIIIVAGYFIYQGFFGNPLEGKWKHDESDMILEVDDHNEAELDWKNLIDGKDVDVGGCFIETSRGMCEIPY